MTDLLKLSADAIDGRMGTDEVGPLNRINFQLSELADDVAMVEAFSHSILFKTDEGLVVFDTSNLQGSNRVVSASRDWSKEPFTFWFIPTAIWVMWADAARFCAMLKNAVIRALVWSAMRTSKIVLIATTRPMAKT